ncbi:MAG: hypothetical protein HRU26_15090 [Psychroserpens sp.]|nr:hypothetical protein [Psychroserpens sp.]
MRKFNFILPTILLCSSCLILSLAYNNQGVVTDYDDLPPCLADAEWFNGDRVEDPKEGAGSPFALVGGKDTSTNCDFHRWSWQKFLYLTQKEKKSDALVMFGDDFYQVNNSMGIYWEPSENLLKPKKLKKALTLVLEDYTQAAEGGTGGVLYTKVGDLPVYYSIHVNKTFLKSAMAAKEAKEEGGLREDAKFLVGSVELKISWIEVEQLKNLGGIYTDQYIKEHFYITNSIIREDNKVVDDRDMKVAMLGMHVVGIVQEHPEFIWATFEHALSAPDYYTGNPTDDENQNLYDKNKVVSSENGFIFYRKGSEGKDCALAYHPSDESNTNTCRLYEFGVPRGLPYAGGTDNYSATKEQKERDLKNYLNIVSINNSVSSQQSNESIWSNYFYSGAIWLSTQDYDFSRGIKGNVVGSQANESLRGSLAVSNITMETFVQTNKDPNNSNTDLNKLKVNNCFTCHNITSNQSTMKLSHIFENFLRR